MLYQNVLVEIIPLKSLLFIQIVIVSHAMFLQKNITELNSVNSIGLTVYLHDLNSFLKFYFQIQMFKKD